MLEEWAWCEAVPGRLIFYRGDGAVLRAVAVRRLLCGCWSDGAAVCREHGGGAPLGVPHAEGRAA